MPERAGNEPSEQDWARQLERSRLHRVRTRQEPWLPGPGAAVAVARPGSYAAASPDGNGYAVTQADWARQLERQRGRMMREHGPWLPGPGAQAAAASAAPTGMAGSAEATETTPDGAADKSGSAVEQFKQHGIIGAIMAFLPPQAQKAAEEATKPVLKQLLAWHWGFIAALETSPIAILLTGPVLNIWLYKKHMQGMPGICKFDIMDLAWLLLYDLLIFLIVLYMVFYIAMMTLVIYAATHPMEALGFAQELGIL